MSERDPIYDIFKREKKKRAYEGWARVAEWIEEYPSAKILAESHGLSLRQLNDGMHYQLINPGEWCLNIYPNNRRIYSNDRVPFIGEIEPWTLTAIINKATTGDTDHADQV